MRRVCVWCGRVWEASRIDPPEDQSYFCPRCEGKEEVWRKLRKDREEQDHGKTAIQAEQV